MFYKGRSILSGNKVVKVLLSLVLVLAMFSQFALPAMAETSTTYTWQTGWVAYSNGASLGCSVWGHNETQGYETSLPGACKTYFSGSYYCIEVNYDVPNDGSTWGIDIEVWNYGGGAGCESASYNTTITMLGSFIGDSPTTATNAANTAASNASTAATNAQNAYNAANTAASNASSANTEATSAANNTTYNSQSAAYWAYQAANSAASNIVPSISSITGQNGATCTTGSTFTANVNISPAGSLTYSVTISGPGGTPGWSMSGNTITISSLTVSGAYTVTIIATYAPSGQKSQGSLMFFKI